MNNFKDLLKIYKEFENNDIYCYYCLSYFKIDDFVIVDNKKYCPYCLSNTFESIERLKYLLEIK